MDERLFPIDDAKRCSTCKRIKRLDEFNRMTKPKDGRQGSCRDCNKAYHYAHWERHMAQIKARSERVVAENRERIIEYLRKHPCVDCGETDIVVLDFDHLRDKTAAVISLVLQKHVWSKVAEEIAKCEVVCANCHRRRTASRANSYRHRAVHGE